MSMIDPNKPLIDLHRHLDGSIRLETIIELGRQHGIRLPAWEVESLRPFVQVTEPQPGVMAFIEKFEWMVGILADYGSCRRVAYENVQDAKAEGLDYLELRFSPWFMAEPHGLDPVKVVEAILDGVESGRQETGMMVNMIGIISRTYGTDTANKELEALMHFPEAIVGLDLAGDEANYPGELFVEQVGLARDAGWRITVHAGESAGPESIWQAINELGAERIGHAVHAIDDPTLMEYMLGREVGIEANLTSNVQTSTVANYGVHPLKQFIEFGLLATINTDDPGISGIDLQYEYNVAAPAAGLTKEQINQAQSNALKVAFLSEHEKADLVDRKGSTVQ